MKHSDINIVGFCCYRIAGMLHPYSIWGLLGVCWWVVGGDWFAIASLH